MSDGDQMLGAFEVGPTPTTAVAIAARSMCMRGAERCDCDLGDDCTAALLYGDDAIRAVTALRVAGFLCGETIDATTEGIP